MRYFAQHQETGLQVLSMQMLSIPILHSHVQIKSKYFQMTTQRMPSGSAK